MINQVFNRKKKSFNASKRNRNLQYINLENKFIKLDYNKRSISEIIVA